MPLFVAALSFAETALVAALGATIGAFVGGLMSFRNARRLDDATAARRLVEEYILALATLAHAATGGVVGLLGARQASRWWPPNASLFVPEPALFAVFA